ncbi:MAG: glycosyltransferase, partial [Candidatus Eisenbacteria bacterium]|nr:glycosyltransferase [Candidatus Eisenbacteria bacterium]
FIRALSDPSAVPRELRHLDRPLVLFGGAAYDWFDTELLLELSAMRPEWVFALVGPRGPSLRRTRLPENVMALGRKSYEVFPRYVARADVTFIPIREGETYESCDPIVVYEYLLCGKAVVATPFPSAVEHGPLVRTADSAQEFAEAIESALAEAADTDAVRRRVEYGFANTWEDRAESALELVSKALAARERTQETDAAHEA